MKKKIVVLMGVLMVSASMLFAGCGSSKTVSSKSNKETEEETKKKSQEDETEEETEEETEDETEEETKEKKTSASHDDWTAYEGTGYTISLSDDWTKTDVNGAEMAFAHLSTSSDGFAENINTITQDISAYDMDLEEYKELSIKQYEQIGYDLVDIQSMEVNGEDGYYVITTVEESGVTCYIAQWFTVVDDAAYVFTFAADEEGFDELEDEVIEIFETVEIG